MQDINNSENWGKKWGVYLELSLSSAQFFYEPETALKNKVNFF